MKKLILLLLCVTFSVRLRAQAAVPLGSASTYAVLAGSTVTNTGPTILYGNLGLTPGSAVTGFPPGMLAAGGVQNVDNAAAVAAQAALTAAYNNAAGQMATATVSGDLGGRTLTSGVYMSTSTLGITGTLTLSGSGFFIFQVGSALTTASSSQVVLINGAQAANVFWQVGSSATLGTGSIFTGSILALSSITLTTGATLDGRALARNGAVTLDSNNVVVPGPGPGGLQLSVTCPSSSAPVGVPYNSAVVATGGTTPYTFSIVGMLPPGLGPINPSTGAITGTPTGGGSTFVAVVVDSEVPPVTASNTCTITNAVGPPAGGPQSVPTLSTWGLGLLALLLVAYAVGFRRKANV
ncbi:MAG TPA: ice-binding family protein [Bryobacteraceae bacterium]|nr:ice-binding family protein [Bryobacteraceae bacterium]